MKTKKVVVGAIAATMLSLSVCPIAPVAANDTVQISVSKVEAKAGDKVTVNVSLADIPSTGIQATDFAIVFDSTYFTIDGAKAGASAITGADSNDPSAADVPLFGSSFSDSEIRLVWTTAAEDPSYWISKDGIFCTISGTVSADAPEGTVIDFKVVPTNRETHTNSGVENSKINCGYFNGSEKVSYSVNTVDGYVKVTGDSQISSGKRGDANCDGKIDMSDAVLVMQSLSNPDKYGLTGSDETHITEQGLKNADVAGGDADKGGDGVTNGDALRIQEFKLELVDEL